MTRKSISNLAKLYYEMAQSETDKKAMKRLTATAEAMDKLLSVSAYLDGLCFEVEELINCDILTNQCDLAISLKGWKNQILK